MTKWLSLPFWLFGLNGWSRQMVFYKGAQLSTCITASGQIGPCRQSSQSTRERSQPSESDSHHLQSEPEQEISLLSYSSSGHLDLRQQ